MYRIAIYQFVVSTIERMFTIQIIISTLYKSVILLNSMKFKIAILVKPS